MSELPLETDIQTVKQLLDDSADFLLLDSREQNEYDVAKIEGASLLPMSEIQQRVGELQEKKDEHIVVHCHHGGRSLQVAQWLQQQGFSKVQSMAGGIDQWSLQIDDTVKRY